MLSYVGVFVVRKRSERDIDIEGAIDGGSGLWPEGCHEDALHQYKVL